MHAHEASAGGCRGFTLGPAPCDSLGLLACQGTVVLELLAAVVGVPSAGLPPVWLEPLQAPACSTLACTKSSSCHQECSHKWICMCNHVCCDQKYRRKPKTEIQKTTRQKVAMPQIWPAGWFLTSRCKQPSSYHPSSGARLTLCLCPEDLHNIAHLSSLLRFSLSACSLAAVLPFP